MSIQNYTILDLPQRLKGARNFAVLGNYPDAITQYKLALSLIESRLKEISDNFLRQKWKDLENETKSEYSQCSTLYNLCLSFKTTPFDLDRKQKDIPVLKSEISKNMQNVNQIGKPSLSNDKNSKIVENDNFNFNNRGSFKNKNNNASNNINVNKHKQEEFLNIMKANDDNLVNIINNNGNHKKSFKTGEKIEFPNPNFKIKNTSVEPRNKNNDQYENNVINLGNNLKENKLKYDKIENNYEENRFNLFPSKGIDKKFPNEEESNVFELTNIIGDFNKKENEYINKQHQFDMDDINFDYNKKEKKDPLVWDPPSDFSKAPRKIPPKKEITKPVKKQPIVANPNKE